MSYFSSVNELAIYLRQKLKNKKYLLLFAYNGTGKTRLSMTFKNLGKQNGNGDTLYFNAFTEDLFSWDNDLDGDSERVLRFNSKSRFFSGFQELEMESRIRHFLHRYADFDFSIDYKDWKVVFSCELPSKVFDEGMEYVETEEITRTETYIKVSRGEENLFIWCLFLAIVQLAMDGAEAYQWVKYIYIDDPVSSLDENNAVAVSHHLSQLLKRQDNQLKTIISSHHPLFFNVLCNELGNASKYFLSRNKRLDNYFLKDTSDTPFFYHVAVLAQLHHAAKSGRLYTYHFNMLRIILEKTASFHGYKSFSSCIKKDEDDVDGILHARLINILNHGNYSLYEPQEMLQENKGHFKKILTNFLANYSFNIEVFAEFSEELEEVIKI